MDVSASMSNHFQELTNQMFDLLDDQLTFSHKSRLELSMPASAGQFMFFSLIRYFNVVSYAQDVNLWRPQLTHCTQDNRAEVQQWINSLTIGGSSCLLSGLNVSIEYNYYTMLLLYKILIILLSSKQRCYFAICL